MLKNQLIGHDGGLQAKVGSLIRSDRPLVAAVVNAIDEHLDGGAQMLSQVTATTVLSLAGLFDHTSEAGRAVLLVAHHGHVPSNAMAGGRPADGGRRWRPWQRIGPPQLAKSSSLTPAGDPGEPGQ